MAYKKTDPKPATEKPAIKKTIGSKCKVTKKQWTYKKYRNGKLDLMSAPARFKVLMSLNATQSRLLSLPAEVRNKIFEYAIGDYDIYISAYNARATHTHETVLGTVYRKTTQHSYRMVTIMLPHGTPFRRAHPNDTLPALCLPQVCRQLYAETAILPYTLNHFKFCDSEHALIKNVGKYTNRNQYSALDLWLDQRSAVQMSAIASLAPMPHYIDRYYWKKRPTFTSLFPGLKSGLMVLFPRVTTGGVWENYSRHLRWDLDKDRVMMKGPCHYETEVEAKLE
ncbi:hypothetical protein Ptr902_10639 [Pyrenophora tritici-repentis]|nr:hypothetical protein PtrEW13061_006741 [Pyrenophora tritici-repentis]KAI2477956.1 hypothetical protein Ptr902_10639 [Pyrenophora tritici-repentis]